MPTVKLYSYDDHTPPIFGDGRGERTETSSLFMRTESGAEEEIFFCQSTSRIEKNGRWVWRTERTVSASEEALAVYLEARKRDLEARKQAAAEVD